MVLVAAACGTVAAVFLQLRVEDGCVLGVLPPTAAAGDTVLPLFVSLFATAAAGLRLVTRSGLMTDFLAAAVKLKLAFEVDVTVGTNGFGVAVFLVVVAVAGVRCKARALDCFCVADLRLSVRALPWEYKVIKL